MGHQALLGMRQGNMLRTMGETKRGTDPRFVGAVDAFARSLAMAKDSLDADVARVRMEIAEFFGGNGTRRVAVAPLEREHEQQAQPLHRLHVSDEVGNGLRIVDVALDMVKARQG